MSILKKIDYVITENTVMKYVADTTSQASVSSPVHRLEEPWGSHTAVGCLFLRGRHPIMTHHGSALAGGLEARVGWEQFVQTITDIGNLQKKKKKRKRKKDSHISHIALEFVAEGPIDNKWALVQVMAWCQPGNEAWHEPMLTKMPDVTLDHNELTLYTMNCFQETQIDGLA